VDTFQLLLPDCGRLNSLTLWTDGAGFGAEWYVDNVEVRVVGSNGGGGVAVANGSVTPAAVYKATFGCWIRGGEESAVARPLTLVATGGTQQGPAGAETVAPEVITSAVAQAQPPTAPLTAPTTQLLQTGAVQPVGVLSQQEFLALLASQQPSIAASRGDGGGGGNAPGALISKGKAAQTAGLGGTAATLEDDDVRWKGQDMPTCHWQRHTVPYLQVR
jgi:hypothetical protein